MGPYNWKFLNKNREKISWDPEKEFSIYLFIETLNSHKKMHVSFFTESCLARLSLNPFSTQTRPVIGNNLPKP